MKSKQRSRNIFHDAVICIFIVVIAFAIIGGYLYHFSYNSVYSEFITENQQCLESIADRHEKDIQVIENVVTQIGLTDDATRFRLEEQPEKAIKLKGYLKRYTTVSSFFNMILYHYNRDDFSYNQATSFYMPRFLKRERIFESLSNEQFAELFTEKIMGLRIVPEQDINSGWLEGYVGMNTASTLFIRTIPPENDETLVFFVPGYYYDSLLASESCEGRMTCLYKDGNILVSRGMNETVEKELQSMMQKSTVEELQERNQIEQQKIEIDGGAYLLSLKKGNSGIVYAVLQPMEAFREKLLTNQLVIVLLLFLCLMLAVCGIAYFFSYLVRKIQNMNMMLNEQSFYDLNSIEKGIQTLVSVEEENKKENLALKKAVFIRNFIRGDLLDSDTIVEEARKVQLEIEHDKYIVVLLQNREAENEDRMNALRMDILERAAGVIGYGIKLVGKNQSMFVLFADNTETLESVLGKMLAAEKEYSQNYVIAVSNYHTDLTEGARAYLEADNAFDYHLLVNNGEIIHFHEIIQKDYDDQFPETYLKRLKRAVFDGDKKNVDVITREIYDSFNGKNISLYSLRILYNNIMRMLFKEWTRDARLNESFYNVFTLSQCMNLQEFCDLLNEACQRIIDNRAGEKTGNSDIVQKAILYMRDNYHDFDLTMNTLAEYLQVSSVTLSIEFKNEMEIGPSEYLTNLRMEKAKEFLCNTSMRIKEISTAVGYEDDGSFIRRFKKYTGVTPGQWRENNMKL